MCLPGVGIWKIQGACIVGVLFTINTAIKTELYIKVAIVVQRIQNKIKLMKTFKLL